MAEEVYNVTIRRDDFTGITVREHWRKDGKSHRIDAPAVIERDAATGVITKETWLKNGLLDRTDGPALIARNSTNGAVRYSAYYRNGEKVPRPAKRPMRPHRFSNARSSAGIGTVDL